MGRIDPLVPKGAESNRLFYFFQNMNKLAEWTNAFINKLPDSSFAYVQTGGNKDSDGLTAPRTLRHLPYKDADGKVDLAHVRNALARLNQTQGIPGSTKDKIKAMLQKLLGDQDNSEVLFFSSMPVILNEGDKTSDVEVLRVGVIQDRGLEISEKMINDYIKNFAAGVYGTEIQVNLEHNRGSAAAGWIKNLYKKTVDGVVKMFATVEWTELGVENISKSLFKFVSAELASHYPHHENGTDVKNVFIGLALTNTPALKGQAPISLSEAEKQLSNNRMLKALLAEFQKRDVVSKADKAMITTLAEAASDEEKEENKTALAEISKKAEEKEVETNLDDKASIVELKEAKTQIKTLSQTVLRLQLDKEVENLMLSETNKTGLVGDELREQALDLLTELKPAQRTTLLTLIRGVQTVDLATKGKGSKDTGGNDDDDDDEDDLADFVTKQAAKLMADGKAKTIEEAQKMASKMYDEEMKAKK